MPAGTSPPSGAGGSKPLGARASALCTSLPRLRSAQFERRSAIGRLLCRGPARGQPGRDSILRSTRADAPGSTSPRFGNTSASRCSGHGTWKNSKLGLSNGPLSTMLRRFSFAALVKRLRTERLVFPAPDRIVRLVSSARGRAQERTYTLPEPLEGRPAVRGLGLEQTAEESMSEHSTCPIWKTPAIEKRTGDGETVDSPRAGGRYSITGKAVEMLQSRDESLKSRLTSWLIEQRRLGVDCPKISSIDVDEIEQRQSLSVYQRADNLLRYIQKQIPKIGMPFGCHIHETDPTFMETLAWSESTKTEEVLFLVNSLKSQGWLSPDRQAMGYLAACGKSLPWGQSALFRNRMPV